MTSELIKRLRERSDYELHHEEMDSPYAQLVREAADELDRLTSAAPAEGGMRGIPRLRVSEWLGLYDELGGDWHKIARRVEDHYISVIEAAALPIDAATEQWVCVPRKLFASSAELASDAYNLNWSKGHDGDVVWQRVWDALLAAQSSPQKTGDKS